MPRLKFSVEYDGARYVGFQQQKNGPSIQEELQRAFGQIAQQPCVVQGAGRTDSGVHALRQVAHVDLETSLSPADFSRGVNAVLPHDISISEVSIAPPDFHARFSACARFYRYVIWNAPERRGLWHARSWHVRSPLQVEEMERCAQLLLGEQDFEAFRSVHCSAEHARRYVYCARVLRVPPHWVVFHIVANAFVQNMVRILAGTLKDVGLGKMTYEQFKEIFESKDRTRAGQTAPPEALTLMNVYYSEREWRDDVSRWQTPAVWE